MGKGIDASGDVLGYGVAVDSGSNVFITGEYTADSEVDVGNSKNLPITTDVASFLVKYDTDGTTQWATKIDGSSTDKGVSVVTGKNGNVHILGNYTSGAIVVSPFITLPDTSGNDTTFLLTYDTQGVVQWATTIDGVGADVVTDSTGAIFVTGSYSSPNSNVSSTDGKDITLVTPSGSATFLVEYSPNGILRTSTHIDGTSNESGNALAVDSLGQNVYVSGTTGSESTIYNSDGTQSGLTLTSGPGFVVKYKTSKPLKLNVSSNLEVGTANLFVDTMTGRVGVNTTSPQATLHTEGNVFASSNLEVGTANLFVDTEVSRVGVRTRVPGFDLDVNGDINFSGDFYKNGVLFTTVIGSTPWSTLESNISYTAGSVSIGVLEPEATLHVEGNVYASSNLEVGGANLFVDTQTSRVGVGTRAPEATLHVEGNVYVSSNLEVAGTTISTTAFDGVPTVSWATRIGGTGFDTGQAIATDSDGNVYVIGRYYGSSATVGSIILTGLGSYNVFIAKYDTSGRVQWAESISGTNTDNGYNIATDSDGNVYVTGAYYGGSATVGSIPLPDTDGSADAFIAKYDTSGTVQWAKSVGDTNIGCEYDIATDSDGNVYVIGAFYSSVTFAADTYLTSTGGPHAFVAKYNTDGIVQWARRICQTTPDYGYGIATDSAGNVYVIGAYYGNDAAIESTPLFNSGTSDDYFVAKYNSSGTFQWAKTITNNSGFGYGQAIATDSDGNVYVTGTYWGSLTIATSPTTSTLPNTSSFDVFVVKYDTYGIAQWAKGISGPGTDNGYGIATDSAGSVYVTGNYNNTVTFALGTTLTSAGSTDVFVAKYDTDGTVQWAQRIGGTDSDNGYGIATDSAGNVYVTGAYISSYGFTIGSTTLPGTADGSSDAFVARYSLPIKLDINTKVDVQGDLNVSGTTTNVSDKRLKSNVHVIGNALEKIGKLSGYTFTMNDKRNAGVIAQEVLEVLPEVVGGSEETTYSVAYGNMAGLFIEAIKELKREIEILKTEN